MIAGGRARGPGAAGACCSKGGHHLRAGAAPCSGGAGRSRWPS